MRGSTLKTTSLLRTTTSKNTRCQMRCALGHGFGAVGRCDRKVRGWDALTAGRGGFSGRRQLEKQSSPSLTTSMACPAKRETTWSPQVILYLSRQLTHPKRILLTTRSKPAQPVAELVEADMPIGVRV